VDTIEVTVPNERHLFHVARLVVGGLAARLDLTYEQIDDLQLAVETVLAREAEDGGQVTLAIEVGERSLELRIGPLHAAPLAADLDSAQDDGLGLGRLLSTLVERVETVERDGAAWLLLEKRVPTPAEAES
jgi:serine/threonine-protein kinase RsbW